MCKSGANDLSNKYSVIWAIISNGYVLAWNTRRRIKLLTFTPIKMNCVTTRITLSFIIAYLIYHQYARTWGSNLDSIDSRIIFSYVIARIRRLVYASYLYFRNMLNSLSQEWRRCDRASKLDAKLTFQSVMCSGNFSRNVKAAISQEIATSRGVIRFDNGFLGNTWIPT